MSGSFTIILQARTYEGGKTGLIPSQMLEERYSFMFILFIYIYVLSYRYCCKKGEMSLFVDEIKNPSKSNNHCLREMERSEC